MLESEMVPTIGERILTNHFDNLYVTDPTELIIGLIGFPGLWVFTNPYRYDNDGDMVENCLINSVFPLSKV